ncbi:MAG: hypothetical protein HY243_15910 [Proteobacteria bacterium]|nr:hypothetical protein [Pseudomonadota bacterium]
MREDLPLFAAQCLKIKAKSGVIVPFRFNRAQIYVHEKLEAQRQRTGRVRAILLKARQQGFSTYIAGRFFHRTSLNKGVQTFILTHEQEATNTLFAMVDRFLAHTALTPSLGAANAKELNFDRLDSGYSVGTAGTKAVGRSKTVQLFHGSEVAHWPNAEAHFGGVVQAVPELEETEIVLESTANGVGGEFHARWQQAEAGIGDYQAIFVPWFWSREYARALEPGFVLDDEEQEYAALHKLSLEQMAWRRAKRHELKDPLLFMQEYPATAAEAFQSTGHDGFIKPLAVLKARKTVCEASGPLVCGGDPARFGDDRFSIAWRRGRKLERVESRSKLSTVDGANWIKRIVDKDRPKKFFVDIGGIGAGVIDILQSWGSPYDVIVVGVNFGSPPQDAEPGEGGGARNRRAEMWMRSRDWLLDERGTDIPDSDSLQADACAPGYKYDMDQRVLLESKQDMRARGQRSPDEWDAVALTFAEPVNETSAPARLEIPNYGIV